MVDWSMVIATIGCVISISSFIFARKDKGEQDSSTSSYKMRTDRNKDRLCVKTDSSII